MLRDEMRKKKSASSLRRSWSWDAIFVGRWGRRGMRMPATPAAATKTRDHHSTTQSISRRYSFQGRSQRGCR